MNELRKLQTIEDDIETLYLYLVRLEVSGQYNSAEYRGIMQKIDMLTKVESGLLVDIENNYREIRKEVDAYSSGDFPINLGFSTRATTKRIKNLFDSISGDAGIEYADALYYDIDRVLLKLLERMIDNPYYERVRRDLIYFKYDIIFLDYKLESDFLLENDLTKVSLESRELQEDLPSHKYISKAILVLEIEEAIKQIEVIHDINERASSYSFVIVKLLQIFARMALCSEEELNFIIDDVHYLMESEEIDEQIKEIMLDIANIFEQIQSSFYFSR